MTHTMITIARLAALAVVSSANLADAQTLRSWRLTPELRIDGAESDLTIVSTIAPSPSGGVYVAQPQDNSIKVFSAKGVLERTIGRKGAGPGEFNGLASIGFVGDRFYATDYSLRRVTLFTADGKVASTISAVPISPELAKEDSNATRYSPLVPMRLVANDMGYGRPSVPSADVDDGRITAVPLFRVGWDGKVQKRLAMLSSLHGTMQIKYDNGRMYTSQPFADDPITAFSANGQRFAVISGDPEKRTIRIVDISVRGDTLGVRSIPYVPQPIPARIVDSVVAGIQKMLDTRKIAADARAAVYVPRSYAAVARGLLHDDGTIWLRTSPPTSPSHVWTVVSPRGEAIATVSVPRTTDLVSLERGVWAIERDKDDLTSVVRFKVEPSPAGR